MTDTETQDLDDEEDFEALYGEWDPSLYDAVMIDENRFALLVGGPRWDDPYTIILTHDARHEQPWSRFDVRRSINALRLAEPGEPAPTGTAYVALSTSGDIYYIGGKELEQVTIPGTQTEDPDSEETDLYDFVWTGSDYVVAGSDGFLKAGKGRQWRDVAPELPIEYPYGAPTWRILGRDLADNLYVTASLKANPRHFNFYPGHPEYREGLSDEERQKVKKRLWAERDSCPRLLALYAGRPGAWARIELPERMARSLMPYPYLGTVHADSPERVTIVGSDGLVMQGNPVSGFHEVSSVVDREVHLRYVVRYAGELVMAPGDRLLRFDGHLLSPFKPKIKVEQPPYYPQVAELRVAGGRLFQFDYGLRYRVFNGLQWRTFELPTALSERPFKGLPPKP